MTMMDRDTSRPHAGDKRRSNLVGVLSARFGMSPRKKSKPNPKAGADGSILEPNSSTDPSAASTASTTPNASAVLPKTPSTAYATDSAAPPTGSASSQASSQQTLNKKPSRKWLSGSWRSKASPVAQLAKESIGVSRGGTAELPGEEAKKDRDPSPRKLLSKRKSSKGEALPASMTKLSVGSDGSEVQAVGADRQAGDASGESSPQKVDNPPLPPDPIKPFEAEKGGKASNDAPSTWGWTSWWSRPDGYSDAKLKDSVSPADTSDAQSTPLPGPTPSEDADTKLKELGNAETPQEPTESPTQAPIAKDMQPTTNGTASKNTSSNSWFWLWSSAQNAQTNPAPTEDSSKSNPPAGDVSVNQAQTPDVPAFKEPEIAAPPSVPVPPSEGDETASKSLTPPKSSGWAFWSREKPKSDDKEQGSEPHKQVGEIAVSNTPSQSHPEAAQFNEQPTPPQGEVPSEPQPPPQKGFRSLRGRPKTKNTPKATPQDTPSSSKPATPAKTTPSHSPTRPETAPTAQAAPKQAPKKQEPQNLILPEFRHTYRMVQKPSYWQQIRQYFLGGEPAMPHLHINPAPPRIRKAIAIGVHGYFPAPLIQKVLGQPTGTSVRFANAAVAAIKEWTEARGYTPEIEKIALEGEGFIADRVNTLWKLLINWIEQIKSADFILVACHSQGVPVAIMLVAKLIQFGCVNAARIGICAMAGVNLGPFVEYKTRYLGATAAELFQFSDPKSLVSQMYLAGLEEVLRYGVRILYIGSIDDQLVSLESSTFSNLSHPYIYRAVFVDGRIHAPDFLTHLVGFALKLRNLGLPDHGLIRELSPALAGSLYTGEGHSRIYEDPRVYTLAVQHALETTTLPIAPSSPRPGTAGSMMGINIPVPGATEDSRDPYALKVKDYESVGSGNQNPYFLPWAMRGLLEEEFVKRELGSEVEELLGLFESWKPVKKELRDVKFRLEGVRSRL